MEHRNRSYTPEYIPLKQNVTGSTLNNGSKRITYLKMKPFRLDATCTILIELKSPQAMLWLGIAAIIKTFGARSLAE